LRITPLDGLRGIWALTVVLHHCMLTATPPDSLHDQPVLWLLTNTPLHLFWAGSEAVYGFFVLSGFVLIWPFRDGSRTGWGAWLIHRMMRLYLPITVAALLSYAVYLTISRPADPALSPWLLRHTGDYSRAHLVHDLFLVDGTNAILNTALWSLRWEVYFSLLVPLVVILVRVRRAPWVDLALGLALLFTTFVGSRWPSGVFADALLYMPMFGLGALMAWRASYVADLFARLSTSRWKLVSVWTAALLLFIWQELPIPHPGPVSSTFAAVLIVGLVAFTPSGHAVGDSRPARWLGRRSFSIYLVHGPIVVSLAYHLPIATQPWSVLIAALPLALLAGHLFDRFVERPLHRLSRRVGTALSPQPARRVSSPVSRSGRLSVGFAGNTDA
jgi:peptidoglycan/LPS O-acetylase OafA/YrhL